ncbi:hypothetical protein N7461_002243 [Penicillium sp. DV-2018c]|nr:hypothetical protein N7461_002243 [Penicillium sp. DV-2018c]
MYPPRDQSFFFFESQLDSSAPATENAQRLERGEEGRYRTREERGMGKYIGLGKKGGSGNK